MRIKLISHLTLLSFVLVLSLTAIPSWSKAQLAVAAGEISHPRSSSGILVAATYIESPTAQIASASEMLDHPMEAPGPWYSPWRVQWHKARLEIASTVGIDVLLVHDNLDPMVSECLIEAARELRSERKGYPWIAPLAHDPESTIAFLKKVPDCFLAKLPTEGTGFGYLVWDTEGLDWSSLEDRWQGPPLAAASQRMGASIARASCSLMTDTPVDRESDLKSIWQGIVKQPPGAVVIEGWDDFASGREILPSREYGVRLLDLTRLGIMQLRGGPLTSASFPWWNVPERVTPQAIFKVEAGVTNQGIRGWTGADSIFLSCQWFKDGQLVYADCPAAPITSAVKPGETVPLTLGLAAARADGTPFDEGDYELRMDLASGGEWFSRDGRSRPISVPVHIGATEKLACSLVESSLPRFLKSDGVYSVTVKVRNDGSQIWSKPSGCALGFHWVRLSEDGKPEIVAKQAGFAPLASDTQPGQTAEARFVLRVRDGEGKAIPTTRESKAEYAVMWDIFDGTSWLTESGGKVGLERVCIVSDDTGAQFFDCNLPSGIAAGDEFEAKVRIENKGPRDWKMDSDSVTCTWYHLDGAPADCRTSSAGIWRDVAVGDGFVERLKVKTPEMPGRYIAEFTFGKAAEPGTLVTNGADSVRREIAVVGSRVEYVDLSATADVTAAAPASDPESGNFDGSRGAFPLERFPPDVTESLTLRSVYPTGYMTGAPASERISFSYLSAREGKPNAVACRGQSVKVIRSKCLRLHILGASIEGKREVEFGIDYKGVKEPARVAFAPWDAARGETSDSIGFASPYALAGGRIMPTRAALFHYVVDLDPEREVTGLALPNDDQVRIVALTLERVREGYSMGAETEGVPPQ